MANIEMNEKEKEKNLNNYGCRLSNSVCDQPNEFYPSEIASFFFNSELAKRHYCDFVGLC